MINKIFLHWTAGRYDQLFRDYHICIDGDGRVHKMADFEQKLAHTYLRNSNAVGIALCCCWGAVITPHPHIRSGAPLTGGQEVSSNFPCLPIRGGGELSEPEGFSINWDSYPPTPLQIQSMARCVARLCKMYGLPVDKETVMTHAEVAEIDGYGVHSHDPEMRWDLLRLPGYGEQGGGEVIRCLAKSYLN